MFFSEALQVLPKSERGKERKREIDRKNIDTLRTQIQKYTHSLYSFVYLSKCVCVCVCVCLRERERERLLQCVRQAKCVCERERLSV